MPCTQYFILAAGFPIPTVSHFNVLLPLLLPFSCFPLPTGQAFPLPPPAPSSPTSALPWGWALIPHPPPTTAHRGQAGPPQRWPGPPLRSGAGGGRPCRPRCTGTYCQQSQFKPPPAAVAVSKCQDSLRGSESCSRRESLTVQELWLLARAGGTSAGCRRNLGQSVRPYPYPLPEPREPLSHEAPQPHALTPFPTHAGLMGAPESCEPKGCIAVAVPYG